jgi:hypothetical protein
MEQVVSIFRFENEDKQETSTNQAGIKACITSQKTETFPTGEDKTLPTGKHFLNRHADTFTFQINLKITAYEYILNLEDFDDGVKY